MKEDEAAQKGVEDRREGLKRKKRTRKRIKKDQAISESGSQAGLTRSDAILDQKGMKLNNTYVID